MTTAKEYGLQGELSNARYIFTAWVLGEEFHVRIPALKLVLGDVLLSPVEKSEALINFMSVFFSELLAAPESRP
jgi:hypothetical protein